MKDKIQQLKLAMQIVENNLDFRLLIQHPPCKLWGIEEMVIPKPQIHNYPFNPEKDRWGVLCGALGNPRETISLIPLEFPKLPDTEQWYNPDNLTPEEVGREYRLLTKTEFNLVPLNVYKKYSRYTPATKTWGDYSPIGTSYRVPRDHPIIITYHAKD